MDDGSLWWPDYSGNNMFNSLGNLADNPEAALLFLDFTTGEVLELSGTAELEWIERGAPGDDNDTGRRIRFRPTARGSVHGPAAIRRPGPVAGKPRTARLLRQTERSGQLSHRGQRVLALGREHLPRPDRPDPPAGRGTWDGVHRLRRGLRRL